MRYEVLNNIFFMQYILYHCICFTDFYIEARKMKSNTRTFICNKIFIVLTVMTVVIEEFEVPR
jgi:hypothetical protein